VAANVDVAKKAVRIKVKKLFKILFIISSICKKNYTLNMYPVKLFMQDNLHKNHGIWQFATFFIIAKKSFALLLNL
jgi:hypothetical protein